MADHVVETNSGPVQLSNKVYDIIQALVELVLPALGVLYVAFATYWHWGYELEVGGSIAAVGVFLGVVIKAARKGYERGVVPPGGYDGAVVEDLINGQPVLRVQLEGDATQNLLNKSQLVIKGFDAGA
jgi:hypothetical protein